MTGLHTWMSPKYAHAMETTINASTPATHSQLGTARHALPRAIPSYLALIREGSRLTNSHIQLLRPRGQRPSTSRPLCSHRVHALLLRIVVREVVVPVRVAV